ncbi:MAG: sugar phosphate isomerase/epimerase [Anaerolineales bacterium]|nr:sugar phosphate isomerase/epimerase [Anaerolineales bacterium]
MDRDQYFEQYAVSSWLYEDNSLEEALGKIAGAGFKKVEIWADLIHLDPRARPDIKTIKTLLLHLNLQVHSIHLPYNEMNLGYPDRSLLEGWLDLCGKTLSYCDMLDCRIAVVHADGPVEKELSRESAQIAKEFVNELDTMAGRFGIRLAVENMVHSDRRSFGCTLVELDEVFPRENIGFCLDTGHAALNGSDIEAEIQAAGERLLSVHANNNNGLSDLHYIPTNGVLDWQQIEKYLTDEGYKGCRVLEVSGKAGDPDGVMQQLEKLWQFI